MTLEDILSVASSTKVEIYKLGKVLPIAVGTKEIYNQDFMNKYFKKEIKYFHATTHYDGETYLEIVIK